MAYGRRLWAALGGDALAALLAVLPLAPDPDSLITIRTDDPELAGIPWEYLHSGTHDDAFLIFDYLLVREVPVSAALLPRPPDPALPWRLVAQGSDPLLQYDMLSGEGKGGKARELILYCERTGQLPNLTAEMARRHANIAGRDVPTQYDEADAVQRLVIRLAKAGVHLLFTTRQSPVGLAGEVSYPPGTAASR